MLFVLIVAGVMAAVVVGVSVNDWRARRRGVRGRTGVDATGAGDRRRVDEADLHMRNPQLRNGGGSLPF